MVVHCSWLVFHGFRAVLLVFHGSGLVFHGFSWFFMALLDGGRLGPCVSEDVTVM